MSRVAVVTGGTRGIGAAISKGLKEAGYNVAATYAGNDEKANAFKAETGISVYKFDVSDYAACEAGMKQIEAEVGPVEVLVNNAGITRDRMFHKMTYEMWSEVIRTNLDSMFTVTRPVIEGMQARKFGRIIIISSINGQEGPDGPGELLRRQGRRDRLRQGARPGERVQGCHRQRHRAGGLHRHGDGDGGAERGARHQDHPADPGGPPRRGRGDRRARWPSSPPTMRAS